MRIIGGLVGWMSPWAKILGGLEPLGPHEVGAYGCQGGNPACGTRSTILQTFVVCHIVVQESDICISIFTDHSETAQLIGDIDIRGHVDISVIRYVHFLYFTI